MAVDDVARGVVLALEKGRAGEAYLLAGENMSYGEFYRMLLRLRGRRGVLVRIPACLLHAAGTLGSFVARLGIPNEMTVANMRILCLGNYCTGLKTKEKMGFCCRSIRRTALDALRSMEFGGF